MTVSKQTSSVIETDKQVCGKMRSRNGLSIYGV